MKLFIIWCLILLNPTYTLMNETRRLELRDQVKDMFQFAFNGYMTHAYPFDELTPLTCQGKGRDRVDPYNSGVNDVLGDYSLTLVDSLDSLAVMGNKKQFSEAVKLVIRDVHFNIDSKVQVFEVTIRMLGGLLSGHLLATDTKLGFHLPWYRGELLKLALDLGNRLLPAFETSPTAFPFARVNLKYGMNTVETSETCTAGVSTILLEFATLSRLTGEPIFETRAREALDALWSLKYKNDLLGNSIDVRENKWLYDMAGIGAGTDSFYEYLLKSAILLNDDQSLLRFDKAYYAVKKYILDESGMFYLNRWAKTANLHSTWIDSLSAFFSGLQVVNGDIELAIRGHLVYFNLWRKYGAIPERYDLSTHKAIVPFYPLRPEFIESTYLLYQATRDPFYLKVGEMVADSLQFRAKTECGYATFKNVVTGELEDRMESFFLSETLKYLYLLFDTDNVFNKLDSNFVLTTEGHILPLPTNLSFTPPEKNTYASSRRTCPKFVSSPFLPSTIIFRPDFDYIQAVIGNERYFLPYVFNMQCRIPTYKVESYSNMKSEFDL